VDRSSFLERRRQSTERFRARGKRAFILHVGIYRWGLSVWLIFSILNPFLSRALFGEPLGSVSAHVITAVLTLPIWLVAGYGFGSWMWKHPPA
jgi:hypothetical protein